jgi:hypothetical protein
MGVKRDKYDAIFSDLVRERAGYTCEHCEKHIPEGYRMAAHCAHIHGRKNQSTRYDPDNAICLCAGCHYKFTDHPTEFTYWLHEYLGDGHMEILREKVNRIKKWGKGEKDEMRKQYQGELKRIKYLRENGEVGRLEFIGYE